jgi:putative FmdB family regulatory protein
MPIYEYKCNSCGKKFEKIEKFSDSPLETHEECGGPVERLISAPTFQFKGTGWYVTDYAKSNGKGKNGSESESESKSKKESSEAKSDSGSSAGSKNSDSSSSASSSSSTPTSSTTSSSDKK